MRLFLLLITVCFFSCKNEIHVSGIIVDQSTRMPLDNVLVRTITDADASKIDFAEARSKNGRFILNFSSQHISSNEITVELSKEGYLTNTYSCFQDKPNDTLFLIRQH
jgi:hypothetical protein